MKNNDFYYRYERFITCVKIGKGNGQDKMNISRDVNQTINTGLYVELCIHNYELLQLPDRKILMDS